MKANRLIFALLLLLSAAVFQLPAQQTEADRKLLDEIKAKAEKGDAKAQCALGEMLYKGEGVKQDYAEAAKWFRKAAEQSEARAMTHLGLLYVSGNGVDKDAIQAFVWFQKSAEYGDAFAQFLVALAYENGGTLPQDVLPWQGSIDKLE